MNPFLEILDSLVESFSTILGRPRAVKPTRVEEQERPADLPDEQMNPAPENNSPLTEPAMAWQVL